MFPNVLPDHGNEIEIESDSPQLFEETRQNNLRYVEKNVHILRKSRATPHQRRQTTDERVANRLGSERLGEEFDRTD